MGITHQLLLRKLKVKKVFKKVIDKIRLLSRKDRESYLLLYSILGFVPGSLKPYRMAMTHSSQVSGSVRKLVCNERLEFLGDAVLSSVTADFLYSNFRREREGFLSKSRSNLVCRERLNELAIEIGLDRFVHACGAENHHNNYIYGNALEALIGAIYIDKGYKQCRSFLLERVFAKLDNLDTVLRIDKNYKSRVIEWAQKNHRAIAFSLVSSEQRKDGAYFVSEVLIDGESYGRGEGFSKRESQQNAAEEALKKLS